MTASQRQGQGGANAIAEVDEDAATRRTSLTSNPTPFNGLPIIYGVVGYMAFVAVALIAGALSITGVGLWPLVLVIVLCALGIWFARARWGG